jgi:hypothetical protein
LWDCQDCLPLSLSALALADNLAVHAVADTRLNTEEIIDITTINNK